ncbi:MBL fold metallo-hydrolase [Streptomyces lonarensis]|uniref:MBL fold metallo-hydrolase n=1 Tax=Streptomyces lonarensis TaxID=700599 RepID=UPI0028ADC577|nr:MBL fold metallo-hydrolase [Streptomyces lonarensis]
MTTATRTTPLARLRSAALALRPASFGAEPAGERLERLRRSPHFREGGFHNERTISTTPSGDGTPSLVRAMLRREDRRRRRPAGRLPLDRSLPAVPPAGGLRLTWLGHATVLVEIDGHRVLFDPVWGRRCSPFSFAGPARVHAVPVDLADLGAVDVVVISHDHYDHLDMPTVRALAASGTRFAVPLGVGAHLEHWGVPAEQITELDWNESTAVGELTLTATPGQHFCGRGLRRRALTLWASWAVAGPEHRVFHSGDTGYFPGFARIGEEHGPFDATMMQIGAYSDYWPDVHMTPEEGLQAHRDLDGGVLLPIHWGTFNLALHSWDEPVERTVAAAEAAGVRYAVPVPGGSFEPAAELPTAPWWRPHAVGGPAPGAGAAGADTAGRTPSSTHGETTGTAPAG